MLCDIRYWEVRVEGLVIQIEKVLHVERHDADVAGGFGLFDGPEVNE